MTRWTHGHSLAAGVAGGLLLDRHVFYIFLIGLSIGGLAVYLSRRLRALAHTAGVRGRELHTLTLDRLAAETERKRAATDESREKTAHRIRTTGQQKRAEDAAWIRGYAEGEHR